MIASKIKRAKQNVNLLTFLRQEKVLEDSLAPLQVFNAFLHSAFSAASKLRTTAHHIRRMFFLITGLASFSCLVLKHLGRLTSSASLEDRAPKAKPSMVASAIPQNLRLSFL
jgi:hypothetical protein